MHDIANDPGVPAALAVDAANVLAAFPEDRAVATCFLEQDEERLQRHLVAIEAAQKVLSQACRCPELSEQTRSSVVATDRHFPQCWEMSKAPWPLPPRAWVEFYLLRDLTAETMQQELQQLGIADTDRVCERLMGSGTPALVGRPVQHSGAC